MKKIIKKLNLTKETKLVAVHQTDKATWELASDTDLILVGEI